MRSSLRLPFQQFKLLLFSLKAAILCEASSEVIGQGPSTIRSSIPYSNLGALFGLLSLGNWVGDSTSTRARLVKTGISLQHEEVHNNFTSLCNVAIIGYLRTTLDYGIAPPVLPDTCT